MERYEDPNDPLNGPRYQTGEACIETGCSKPAGTHWSPIWCHAHNVERMHRVNRQFDAIMGRANG